MVRLKDQRVNVNVKRITFQFLMVRLKVTPRVDYAQGEEFQFLMVRLKENEKAYQRNLDMVSIPYGTIKRKKNVGTKTRMRVVSIPYGTIKRFFPTLVALPAFYVSIPYGTIKSHCHLCRKRRVSQVSIPYGTIKRSKRQSI